MNAIVAGNRGIMLAMMEPPATLEDEFQQWYDTEHFPERAGIPGFLTAIRGICIDGWPRYVAIYDLEDVGVLDGPEYSAIANGNYSIWTDRIMPRVWGQYRAVGTQIYPGNALLGDSGAGSRIIVWRFGDIDTDLIDTAQSGMQAICGDRPEIAQVRMFRCGENGRTDLLALIEAYVPWQPSGADLAALGPALRHVDMVNTYTRYRRSWGEGYPQKGGA